jgi:hypothetical protein
MNYSGTLYQTSFGEKKEKFFHVVDLESKSVKSVRHTPRYTLENIVVNTVDDLSLIPDDPRILVKLFIKSKVTVPDHFLDRFSNVVKHNSFTTKKELQILILEDFTLDDVSGSFNFDTETAIADWLTEEKVPPKLAARTLKLNRTLLASLTQPTDEIP